MSEPRASTRHRFRPAVVLVSVAAAVAGSILLATHNSSAKVTTRGVTATLRTPGHPGWVAAGDDALWLAVTDARRTVRTLPLLRLDAASGAVRQRVSLGGRAAYLLHLDRRLIASVEYSGSSGSGPSLIAALDWRTGRILVRSEFPGLIGPLAESGGDLWALRVRPAALLRLDRLTLAPTAAPIPLSKGRAVGLAAAGGFLWTSQPDSGDVLRIDGATKSVSRVHVGGFPVGVTVAGGNVWYADRDGGKVGRLDPWTLLPVGKAIQVGGKPGWLASAGRSLCVADPARGTVTEIDLRSGVAERPAIRVGPPAKDASIVAVVAAGNSVWVSNFTSSTLTRVRTAPVASAQLIASIRVPPQGGAFTVGDSGVWAMSDATSTLMRIDPARNAITARIHVSPGGDAAAGDGAVWLSHPQENSVSRIDAETNKVSATIRVPWASGVAVSPGAVWIADAGGPSVERIDPATNRVVARIRVGPKRDCCGERMGLTADGDAVWVANSVGRRVVRIDPRTNKVVDNIDLEHFMPCGFIVADRSTVWSAGATCTAAVARIDPRTRKVTAQLAEPHAVGMALAFGSLWVAVFDTGDVDRIDTRTGQVVARLHVGGWPVRLSAGFGSVWVNDDKGRVLRIRP